VPLTLIQLITCFFSLKIIDQLRRFNLAIDLFFFVHRTSWRPDFLYYSFSFCVVHLTYVLYEVLFHVFELRSLNAWRQNNFYIFGLVKRFQRLSLGIFKLKVAHTSLKSKFCRCCWNALFKTSLFSFCVHYFELLAILLDCTRQNRMQFLWAWILW